LSVSPPRSDFETVSSILYAVFLWQSLFYMNFAIRGRYAMPMYPLVLIVAVLGVGVVVRRRKRGVRDLPAAGIIVRLLGIIPRVFPPYTSLPRGGFNMLPRLGVLLLLILIPRPSKPPGP